MTTIWPRVVRDRAELVFEAVDWPAVRSALAEAGIPHLPATNRTLPGWDDPISVVMLVRDPARVRLRVMS